MSEEIMRLENRLIDLEINQLYESRNLDVEIEFWRRKKAPEKVAVLVVQKIQLQIQKKLNRRFA
jgi:UDP-N-acetylglucosamine pyrophosphorylase